MTRLYTSSEPPQSREELHEAFQQWARERRYGNPAMVMAQWLEAELRREGFVIVGGMQDHGLASFPRNTLAFWVKGHARHPDSAEPFAFYSTLKFEEDGRSELSLELAKGNLTSDDAPGALGVEPLKQSVFLVEPKEPLTPQTWGDHARQTSHACFAETLTIEEDDGSETPASPIQVLKRLVMDELRTRASA